MTTLLLLGVLLLAVGCGLVAFRRRRVAAWDRELGVAFAVGERREMPLRRRL
ncbi:LPXTG cell wall anchor domain-containing protein [Nocardioides mesophilus]|uniref:LPXTG cell wall anchor domain-containing protein n=1 Tax=Nocardioides mesophilus TaxID=433659 RepID=A0A7G9RB69_9ACTN|nr:LPXTG cell wall anchor domain-containing protein [Nocardioides mesophilus]QNN52844.1 LPXTG cell wall anchor domain-containing protein [Nocardioides mesophilus]